MSSSLENTLLPMASTDTQGERTMLKIKSMSWIIRSKHHVEPFGASMLERRRAARFDEAGTSAWALHRQPRGVESLQVPYLQNALCPRAAISMSPSPSAIVTVMGLSRQHARTGIEDRPGDFVMKDVGVRCHRIDRSQQFAVVGVGRNAELSRYF